MQESVKIEAFTKIYGKNGNERKACDNVDFEAVSGSITGILGPNGAGKSTLLKAAGGIVYPTSGTVTVAGFTDLKDIRSVTGNVPEFPRLDGKLTVKEALTQNIFLHGYDKKDLDRLLSAAIKAADLDDVLYQKISSLSKGYTQRVSFALAVSFDPKVLILDEFSGGLDPAQIVKIRRSIKKLAEKKIVILSTHLIQEAESLCDYIYVMNEGHVVARGTKEEIIRNSNCTSLEKAFLKLTEAES
ncbi:MAG: ABC transporter ATP-binding protein [Treponema sp.]|nr:ABC transporter ATP-binding protein [Treponema sp.]